MNSSHGQLVILDVMGTIDTMDPYPANIQTLLAKLKENNFTVVIATGDDTPDWAERILLQARIDEAEWPRIYTLAPKGHASGLAAFVERLGFSPANSILIDDAETYIKTAASIGMSAIQFASDYSNVPTHVFEYVTDFGTPSMEKHTGTVTDIVDAAVDIVRKNMAAAKAAKTAKPEARPT